MAIYKSTALLRVATALILGASPPTSGTIRVSNPFTIIGRNALNTIDVSILTLDGSNNQQFGDLTTTPTTSIWAATSIRFAIGGNVALINSAGLQWTANADFLLNLASSAAAATGLAFTLKGQGRSASSGTSVGGLVLLQGGDATGATATHTGGKLQLRGGDATGASGTRTGGDLEIRAGTGASANGALTLFDGATARLKIDATGIGFFNHATAAQPADMGALTDNSGGAAADGTIAAMPDPADTPATADALRDDLVANTLPKIRDNFADVVAKINTIRTALRATGYMA